LASCKQTVPPPTATPKPRATPTPTTTVTATATPLLPPGDSERTVDVDGGERSYLLHVPPDIDDQAPVPVMFFFHGWEDTPENMRGITDFNPIADANGFLVVYPRGSGTSNNDLSWNAGICCGFAVDEGVDEAAFVRRMLEDLETITRIDSKRIYATGHSNGGFLVYRLGCELSDTFAAIAPVSGVLGYAPCQPQQPVSVLHIHGMVDIYVPFEGGGDVIPGGFPPVMESIQTWLKLNACAGEPQLDEPYRNVVHTDWGECQAGTTVELYTIDLFGHRWPLANTFPASQTIWEFFDAHTKV
jgi:polyhydroxybutyrate depolymerase